MSAQSKKSPVGTSSKLQNKKKQRSPNFAVSLPAAFGGSSSTRQFSQRKITLSGCDLVSTVSVGSSDLSQYYSFIMGSLDLNPNNLAPNGRLPMFARLYEKYQYKKLRLFYVPNVGTQTSGCIQIAADNDPLDTYVGLENDALTNALTGNLHNKQIPVYLEADLDVTDKSFFDKVLYTDTQYSSPDGQRWVSPGKIWWASVGPLAMASSYGRLFVEWTIEFSEPSNDSAASIGTAIIGTTNSTAVTSTYPWGDYTVIKDTVGPGAAYVPSPSVSLYSDPTLGSVIKFNSRGPYTVVIYRTGVAMGTGAFTSAVLSAGVQSGWPDNSGAFNGLTAAIANSASTASMWTTNVYVSVPGATLSSTTDSGVTHSSAFTFVTKNQLYFTDPANVDSVMTLAIKKLQAQVQALLMAPSPAVGSALDATSTSTSVEKDGSGGPDKVVVTTGNAALTNGLEPVNVVTPGFAAPKGFVLVPDYQRT